MIAFADGRFFDKGLLAYRNPLISKNSRIVLVLLFVGVSMCANSQDITFSPSSGTVGSSIVITGSGFDLTPANNIVWFGGMRGTVTAGGTLELMISIDMKLSGRHMMNERFF